MTDDGLRSAAYHEAGHAVVALALGLHVDRVEIFHEDYSGDTEIVGAGDLPLVDRIAICVAGMDAGEMFHAPAHEFAYSRDFQMVVDLLEDIAEAESDALRKTGHQRAWDLLGAHSSSVEDIAAQLLAERKINLTGYVLDQ
jgi:ATP-dependent Zn protease